MNVNSYTIADITIVSGPQNTTVCLNDTAEMNCGYNGTDPKTKAPTWRIISRSDNGSVISNCTIGEQDVLNNNTPSDLQWVPDLNSGNKSSPNSKLLVGPVNKTHNQSSYQCSIEILADSINSSVGTITVVGVTTWC